jgi:hypothetical protein
MIVAAWLTSQAELDDKRSVRATGTEQWWARLVTEYPCD